MMKRKVLATALSLAMVATLFAGCGSSSEKKESSAKDETVKIQFMHMQVEQERQDVLSEVIKKFEKENPNIKVDRCL